MSHETISASKGEFHDKVFESETVRSHFLKNVRNGLTASRLMAEKKKKKKRKLLENFKSCLALWPMRLRLYSIPTPKTKIFGSGPNETKSPYGWFLLFERRMSWRTANSFRINFYPCSVICDHLLPVASPNNKLLLIAHVFFSND